MDARGIDRRITRRRVVGEDRAQALHGRVSIASRPQGTVQPGAMDFWAFPGKEGKTVFLSVRSDAFQPTVSVRSPDGVRLAADDKGSVSTGSLVALKLPRTGRYTVWISSRRGAGEYRVRLIDGD